MCNVPMVRRWPRQARVILVDSGVLAGHISVSNGSNSADRTASSKPFGNIVRGNEPLLLLLAAQSSRSAAKQAGTRLHRCWTAEVRTIGVITPLPPRIVPGGEVRYVIWRREGRRDWILHAVNGHRRGGRGRSGP